MIKIKERGNDNYTVRCNSANNLKVLASRGYIKEIGECLFLWNQVTELWEVYDARYVHLLIPDYPQHKRIYTVLDTKFKLFSKKLKPANRPPTNKVEIARDEFMTAVDVILEDEMTYRQFYEYCTEYFELPPFRQVKGREDHE